MKKLIFLVVLLIIFLVLYINVNAEIIVPSDAIRIRVIPNSNSVIDQNMKDMVRDYVSNYMSKRLDGIYSVEEARDIIRDSVDEVSSNIEPLFRDNDYDMDFKIIYGDNYFPNKEYRGVIYPSGDYESMVIYIGESRGNNWWCVLFPPLCLLEASEDESNSVTYRSLVKDIIDKFF